MTMSFFLLFVTLISVTLVVPVSAVSGADIVSNTSTTNDDDSSSSSSYSFSNRELTYPEIWDVDELEASNKIITLDLDWLEINPGFRDDDDDENENENDETSSSSSSSTATTTSRTRRSTPFVTRALGGSVPGPTIKVSPGTTVKIKFRNQLTYQPESQSSRRFDVDQAGIDIDVDSSSSSSSSSSVDLSRLNKFNDPDTANLHCHGCHISAVLPSDDTTLQVGPQTEYEYEFTFPLDHSPGMYWLHPHHHGSSTLHLVGGAALAIIVKDQEDPMTHLDRTATATATDSTTIRNTSSDTVTSVKERILIFQDWDVPEAIQVARMAGDRRVEQNWSQNIQNTRVGASIGQRFVTINGMYHPIITSASLNNESESESTSKSMECGKWERWRILYAGWQDLPLNLGVQQDQNKNNNKNNNGANCEFYLLAKDGIYLTDYPRGPMMTTTTNDGNNNNNNNQLPIPPGGRTDLMVRCNRTGTTKFEALSRRNILTIQLNCESSNSNSNSSSSSSGSSSSNHDNDNDNDNDDASNSNSTT